MSQAEGDASMNRRSTLRVENARLGESCDFGQRNRLVLVNISPRSESHFVCKPKPIIRI
jgi:hypothetical protein